MCRSQATETEGYFTAPVHSTCELPQTFTAYRMGRFYYEGRKEDPRTFSFQTAGMQAHQIFGAKQRTAQSSWYWHETKKAAVVKQKKVHHWLTYINIVITKVAWSMAGLTTCKLSPNENAHIKKNIFTLLPYRRKNLWI